MAGKGKRSHMRVVVATTQVPFIHGGAAYMTAALLENLKVRGVGAEHVTRPFRFRPSSEVLRSMDEWAADDADAFDCGPIDRVICLNFPSFYLKHHDKVVWLMHQHRSVYELFGTPYGADASSPESSRLKREITQRDTASLHEATHVHTISKRVSARLKHFNDVESDALYQPPPNFDRYYTSEQLPYIFVPSRLEALKRQDLLLRALAAARAPVAAIFVGEGGCRERFERLAGELGVEARVRFVGRVEPDELIAWYANCLAVFFGPHDEDYGFVTLEAMLSSKPVLTCSDSGGSLEFVHDEETGFVCAPDPAVIASRIDWLWANRGVARELGRAGRSRYESLGISWNAVLDRLLA